MARKRKVGRPKKAKTKPYSIRVEIAVIDKAIKNHTKKGVTEELKKTIKKLAENE